MPLKFGRGRFGLGPFGIGVPEEYYVGKFGIGRFGLGPFGIGLPTTSSSVEGTIKPYRKVTATISKAVTP